MTATFFSSEGARRVIDQTIRGERRTDPATGDGRSAQTGPLWAWVKVTGAGTSSTGWTGKVLLPITTNDLADETSDAIIYSAVPNEVPDVPGGPYIARLSGWDDARSKSTWQALFVAKECCTGGGPGTGGVCQVTPPPQPCPPCLFLEILDSYGNQWEGYLPAGQNFGLQFCTYAGTIGPVNITISIGIGGIDTHLSESHGPNWVDVFYFACSPWDGQSGVTIGGMTRVDRSGGIGIPAVLSAVPVACPPGGGGGGGLGTGGGDVGGGGTQCFTGICPYGVPCTCCSGYRSVELNNGGYACVPDNGGGLGGFGSPSTSSGGCGCSGGGASASSCGCETATPAGMSGPGTDPISLSIAFAAEAAAAAVAGVSGLTVVGKATDETTASDTTLSSDSALTFNLEANKNYCVKLVMFFDCGSGIGADGFKYALTGPASPTLVRVRRSHFGPGAIGSPIDGVDTAYTSSTAVTCTSNNGGYVEMDILIQNGANAGAFAFQWAQATSTAVNTTVRAGSYLTYRKLN